jgi:AcrR family transcriptional regulator
MARANAYQALHGLEAKGAAERTVDAPPRFRPIHPEALLAAIVDRQASRIEALALALRRSPQQDVQPSSAMIHSLRALDDLILRSAARAREAVDCLGSAELLRRLAPAWHKRLADELETRLWVVGEGGGDLPIPPAGHVAPDTVGGGLTLALSSTLIVAAVVGRDTQGFWSNDPLQVWLGAAALRSVTS